MQSKRKSEIGYDVGKLSYKKGTPIKVKGSLILPEPRKIIEIHVKKDQVEVIRKSISNECGEFEYTLEGLDAGDWKSWASWMGDECYEPAKSQEQSFKVEDTTTEEKKEFPKDPRLAIAGAALMIAGIILALYWANTAGQVFPLNFLRRPILIILGLTLSVTGINLLTYGVTGWPERPSKIKPNDFWQLAITAVVIFFVAVGALWALRSKDPLSLAILSGIIGGLIHEVAQSKGTIFFPDVRDDGVFLGGIGGMLLGGVAGLLLFATPGIMAVELTLDKIRPETLAFNAFLAGLALKGVSEAAGTTSEKKEKKEEKE